MVTQKVDYRAELEKLPPEERESYISGWRDYLGKLPRQAYVGQLTRLAQQFGPEFASSVIQPELVPTEVEPAPIAEVPAKQLIAEKETPWYLKPLETMYKNPLLQPAFKGIEQYHSKWLTPAAMTVAQPFAPKLREQLEGRSIWSMPEQERKQIWEEESGLPWLARTGLELIVDPTFYFGWGLAPKAMKGLEKAGYKTLARAIKPIASAEEAYIRAAAVPVKAVGKAIRKLPKIVPVPQTSWVDVLLRGGKVSWLRPLEESPKSVARNLPIHTGNALLNLYDAGGIPSINKPFSQILADIKLGVPDRTLLSTITNPKQRRIIEGLVRFKDKLGLDELIRNADKEPGLTSAMLGQRLIKAMAPELGIESPKMLTGTLASYERYSNKLYSLWKRTVLMTPYYMTQNVVENTIRPMFVGVNPFTNIQDYAKLPSLGKMPVEIQNLVSALMDDLGKPLPANISKFAMTPELGGMTEAVIGGITRGKLYIPTHGAAFLDRSAMLRTFMQGRDRFVRTLMETGDAQVRGALVELDDVFRVARKAGITEEKLLDHLEDVATSGTLDDFIHEMNVIQKTKHLTIARPMTSQEQALPEVVRQRINKAVPGAWAKNDVKAITRAFDDAKRLSVDYVNEYQRLALIQNLREFRNMVRSGVPARYQKHVTKFLNKYKYPRISEAEARLSASKTLTDYERASFDLTLAHRRELELLAEENIVAEIVTKNASPEALGAWLEVGNRIDDIAFKTGDDLVKKTFSIADVVRHGKDPIKIKQAWDNYIMEIQSLAPDLADMMRASAPDNDLLWQTYRKVQEQRWFNVGQDKIRAAQEIAGVKISGIPQAKDAAGKVLTLEDFMQAQKKTIDSWETRALQAWEKRFDKATPKDKLLDGLREQTIRIKEGMALQELQIQSKANDMAMDLMYSTFGNYASRTGLDEFMTSLGVPFWFFPSRSIPFYTTQMIQHPRLGMEVVNLQNSRNESEQPARVFGTIRIPGTNYYYNPLQASMLWQLANARQFTPAATGGLEQGMEWMRNNLSVSLGPQWRIGAALVERVMAKQAGATPITGEPQPLVPQQRWLEAIGHKKLPIISQVANFINEPFDMYLRAVYGDNVAEWSKREVEKTIVDMGYNPQTAPKEVIEKAWDRYYTRQLLSIPGGAVKELTPTELARFEAINKKAKEIGLTTKQRVTLRELGESPFVGLRQDQMEAIYKDIPAQKLWRYIRPYGLTSESRPIWDDYIQFRLGRETLLYGEDKDNPTEGSRLWWEQKYDKALQSGQISPREWKSLYRNNYANYISRVEQLEKDTPLAPRTDADWEAYRELLDWDEPVRHLDDIKLDEYYEVMDSSKFENELGEFDYDAYRKTEAQFFSGLSPDTVAYIKSRKDRYKTPLRAAYGRDMEKVQPYYDIQSAILAQYPPEIAQIIKYALASPDIAIQRAVLINYPQAMVALRRVRVAKDQYRLRNPAIDHLLRFWSS